MAYTYSEIKALANNVRDKPLVDVLILAGAVRDPCDAHKWHTPNGAISVTGQQFMNWKLACGGGGAIDMVIHLLHLDFVSAVLWLVERFPSKGPVLSPVKPLVEKPPFSPPQKNAKYLPKIIHYLHHIRKIPLNLIHQLIGSGQLYADDKVNAVFILHGKEKKVVGAELRGTSKARWIGLSKGSQKDLGAFYITTRTPEYIVICESAIDAISCFALHPICTAISSAGVNPSPPWLNYFIDRNIEIFCGFDADEAGDKAASAMLRLFPRIKRLRPAKKDWNEVLMLHYQLI